VGTRVNDKAFHVDFNKVLEVSKGGEQQLSLDTQAAHAPVAPPAVPSETQDHHAAPAIPPPIPIPDMPAKDSHDKPKDTNTKEAADDEQANKDDKQEEGFNWLSTMMIIIYVNIVLLLLGGIGYLVWKKRKAKLEKEQEELSL